MSALAVAIVRRPPSGMASRALMARFSDHLLELGAIGHGQPEAAGPVDQQLHVLADQPAQHRVEPGHDLVQVDHSGLR